MAVSFPQLPFPEDHLEPYMSKSTLRYHHGRHHKKYVETLNKLIIGTSYERFDAKEILLRAYGKDEEIFNNAAQAWNHSFFWNCLERKRKPSVALRNILDAAFDDVEVFKRKFEHECTSLFGSGWVWLVRDRDGELFIRQTKDAENPLIFGETPILVCDVWEHAYYLDYQNDRAQFLKNFWNIVNWDFVEANLTAQAGSERELAHPARTDH